MNTRKIIQLLQHFSKKDMAKFHRFITQKNRANSKKMHLWHILKADFPDFTTIDFITIEKQLNKNQRQKANLPNLLSRLVEDVHLYLILTTLEENPLQKNLLLLEAYKKRKIFNNYMNLNKRIRKTIQQSQQPPTIKYHSQIMQLHLDLYYYANLEKATPPSVHLEKSLTAADLLYFSLKLKVAAELHNRTLLLSEEPIDNLLIKQIHKTKLKKETKLIQLYRQLFELYETQKESAFLEFQQEILNCIQQASISESEQLEFYIYLINFCIRACKDGQSVFGKYLLELYQMGIDTQFLFKDGYLPVGHFINAIDISIVFKDIITIGTFIHKNQKYLIDSQRKEALFVAELYLKFYEKKYEKVLELINQNNEIKVIDMAYILRLRTFQIRSNYELGRYDTIIKPLIPNFKKNLKSHLESKNISTKVSEANLNFANLVLKIIRYARKRQEITSSKLQLIKQQLKKDLENCKPIVNRKWLEDIISRL